MMVLDQIARGGFGRVERVRLESGEIVARKVFEPDSELVSLNHEKLRKRFVHEVEVQRRLASHGSMPVLEADLTVDPPWYTMPLAEKSFRLHVQAERAAGTISPEPLADILNALEEVHRLGYAHRDLKPENILLVGGTWRLADFGLVAIPHADEATRLTSTASGWATVAYCAPEQAMSFKNADKSVDIYAFGCILHDIVGTRPRIPFQVHTAKGPVGAIISRCTQTDPRQRFRSVAALRSALLDAIGRTQSVGRSDRSAETEGWRKELARIHEWDSDKLEELIVEMEEGDKALCFALDEERLVEIHGIDPIAWRRVALAYCDYAQGTFDFGYCDVVAGCLLEIFDLGDIEIRASAAMSAALLATKHNRWFALKKVIALCGKDLDPDVAERLAIDIRAYERQDVFEQCAKALAKPITVFHPTIVSALSRSSETNQTVREGGKGRA
jgi:hypothetical protein